MEGTLWKEGDVGGEVRGWRRGVGGRDDPNNVHTCEYMNIKENRLETFRQDGRLLIAL
jgi:hypothetical protein